MEGFVGPGQVLQLKCFDGGHPNLSSKTRWEAGHDEFPKRFHDNEEIGSPLWMKRKLFDATGHDDSCVILQILHPIARTTAAMGNDGFGIVQASDIFQQSTFWQM